MADIAAQTDLRTIGGVAKVVDAVAAFDVAAADFEQRLAGNEVARRRRNGRWPSRSSPGNRAAQLLIFLRRHQRVVAVHEIAEPVGPTRAKERAGRRDLGEGMVVGEHEVRIDFHRRVDRVMREEPTRVARVGALQVVQGTIVEEVVRRSNATWGHRIERTRTERASAVFEEVILVARETARSVVDRNPAVVVRRTGAFVASYPWWRSSRPRSRASIPEPAGCCGSRHRP